VASAVVLNVFKVESDRQRGLFQGKKVTPRGEGCFVKQQRAGPFWTCGGSQKESSAKAKDVVIFSVRVTASAA